MAGPIRKYVLIAAWVSFSGTLLAVVGIYRSLIPGSPRPGSLTVAAGIAGLLGLCFLSQCIRQFGFAPIWSILAGPPGEPGGIAPAGSRFASIGFGCLGGICLGWALYRMLTVPASESWKALHLLLYAVLFFRWGWQARGIRPPESGVSG